MRLTMSCLSSFKLYSRRVPLLKSPTDFLRFRVHNTLLNPLELSRELQTQPTKT